MEPVPDDVAAIRRFSRFYTRVIGALDEGFSGTRFSLTEARVLYELARTEPAQREPTRGELAQGAPGQRKPPRTERVRTKRARTGRATASTLVRTLEIDPAYLSRILAKFEQEGLLRRAASETDRRASTLILTPAGRSAFAPLDEHASRRAADLLAPLPLPARAGVVAAMARIEAELAQTHEREPGGTAWTLHPPKPGDIGWVIARHGALYAAEYGLDHRFEALVARVAGAWLAGNDPVRERCWIAEVNGMNAGSVFLVRGDADTAKLRLLIVEPWARGLGIGKALVEACIGFARETKYKQIVLWTNDVLLAARGIYRATGFRLVASQPHNDFGPAMAGEDWELDLT